MGPLGDGEKWRVDTADCRAWLASLPDGSARLTKTSPPYELQRTYGIGFKLKGMAWVEWMAPIIVDLCRVTNGLVCVNMAGPVRDFRYVPVVEWLVADLTRQHGIVCGPSPYVYFRRGIPGSGGPHYHKRDWEPVYCFARQECLPLTWADNTAMGHPPKWAPGGEMSHRLSNGKRVNAFGVRRDGVRIGARRGDDCHRAAEETPAHASGDVPRRKSQRAIAREVGYPMKTTTSGTNENGFTTQATYIPPAVANPGSLVQDVYTSEEVLAMLGDQGDVVKCDAGGNRMGDPLAHQSEAPFSERLAEFFIRSYCPPGEVTLDPFSGSGTTAVVAVRCGRRALACDLRASQVELSRKRIRNVTAELFTGTPDAD